METCLSNFVPKSKPLFCMDVKTILNTSGCIVTIGFGLFGLLMPEQVSALTGLEATTPSAMAEFRGTFGGAFLVMGLFPLLVKNPKSYLLAGLFWWGAAAGRVLSLFADAGFSDPKNFGGLGIEVLFGLLLIIGNHRAFRQQ